MKWAIQNYESSVDGPLQRLALEPDGTWVYTSNFEKALCFARRQDADMMARNMYRQRLTWGDKKRYGYYPVKHP